LFGFGCSFSENRATWPRAIMGLGNFELRERMAAPLLRLCSIRGVTVAGGPDWFGSGVGQVVSMR
jgi:hypothetical protein